MISKMPAPDVIGGGNRFSDKIMRNKNRLNYSASAVSASFTQYDVPNGIASSLKLYDG